MKINYRQSVIEGVDLVLPFFKDKIDYSKINHINGGSFDFEGKAGEVHTLYTTGTARIYLLGLGEEKTNPAIIDSFRKLVHKRGKYWNKRIQVDLGNLKGRDVLEAVIGLEMSTYSLRKDDTAHQELEIDIIASGNLESVINNGRATGQTINAIKSLVDAPPNVKTPEYIASFAQVSAKTYGYNCKIWESVALKEKGFETILAVGKGSINAPRLIELTYTPLKDQPVQLGLVGKGITFDSGGLSIKPAQNMHYMKSDMGGAAAVLGIVELAAKLELPINLAAIIPCAENAVDGNSYRPGDVIQSYSGKTIEVIDTDAEGRLVLADGLSYITQKYQPEQLIDLATLTGSVVRTLGYSAAGAWSTSEQMLSTMTEAGAKVNERIWALPLYEEYRKELESDVADIRNLGSKPIAGASIAATFLQAFTGDHKKWMHLDIAGTSFGDSSFTKMKAATGYGVRLIIEYIQSLIQSTENETD